MSVGSFFSILFLLSIVALVNGVSAHPRSKKFFKFIPSVFWIYFLPMVFSALGLVDSKNPVFTILSSLLLPAALLLLLLSSDVKGILKCGRPALTMMFAGSLGIMVGTPLVFLLFKNLVGPQFWSGFGALSGSWIGGSANMIAVKESIGTPEPVFLPMVIVDTVVPYVWMGLLVGMAGLQPLFDKWNRADRSVIDEMAFKSLSSPVAESQKLRLGTIALIAGVTVAGVVVSRFLARLLPEIKDMISTYAWTIIIVSALGVLLSCTTVKKLENFGASKTGYFLLYLVLASIGARAGVVNVGPVLFLILAGFLIVFFHAGVLFLTARIIRAPLFLAAVASQANIGGVASAPIVASIYQPGLASIGLLLAICGNITGTYLGIITSQFCRFVAEKL
jgi:uncharacterized membrane protein